MTQKSVLEYASALLAPLLLSTETQHTVKANIGQTTGQREQKFRGKEAQKSCNPSLPYETNSNAVKQAVHRVRCS
jgi:hypothetical protein